MAYPPIGVVRLLPDAGGLRVEISVPDIASAIDAFGTTGVLRIHNATSATGSFSNHAAVTLVADETFYPSYDTDGAVTTWFRYRFENAGATVVSAWSPVFVCAPYGLAFGTMRQELAKEMGMYASGTTTAAGSSSTVVDSGKIVSISNTNQWRGGWLKMTSGAANGEVRNISDYAIGTGIFTVTPVLSGGSGSSATYEVYRDMSPTDLDEAINDALMLLHIEDEHVFSGDKVDPTFLSRREYQMPMTITKRSQIIGLERHMSWGEVEGERRMSRWEPVGNGGHMIREQDGAVWILFYESPGANSVYRVRYLRPYTYAHDLRITADTTQVTLPLQDVITAAKYQAYDRLIKMAPPNAKNEEWVRRRNEARASWHKLIARYSRRSSPLFEQGMLVTVE